MWFDTHSHLYDLERDGSLEAALERATVAGVTHILTVGVDVETSQRCRDLARAHPSVHAGAAFHPTEAKGWDDGWAEPIDELLADDEVVAVGETGLDLYWDRSYLDDQLRMFTRHIELAKKHDKALIIHTRDSVEQALDVLEREGPPDGLVFHCWSGSRAALRRALKLGAHVSFAGNVSFRNAPELREAATAVPLDRLLVETDSPYLAPVPHRGKPNEPSFVIHVGQAVAEARGEETALLAEATTANARALFRV